MTRRRRSGSPIAPARNWRNGQPPGGHSSPGKALVGPQPQPAWLAETRSGATAVSVGMDSAGLYTVALAPVSVNGSWVGAAGIADPIDARAVDALARLTRSDVTVLVGADYAAARHHARYRGRTPRARALHARSRAGARPEIAIEGRTFLAVVAPLGASSHIVFSRDQATELAVVPQLRRVALVSAIVAVGMALLLGVVGRAGHATGARARPRRHRDGGWGVRRAASRVSHR